MHGLHRPLTDARRIRVRGQVQGVGFRPFVWQLANRLGLSGEVLNDAEGVLIHVAGDKLDDFESALVTEAPALAVVDAVESETAEPVMRADFRIEASGGAGAETRVTPDAATCTDCAAEIRDPSERRFGYAFANCTNCGPRFTILEQLPYDRANTTMLDFAMCEACRVEYENPGDRRFHAQPIACPTCGPRLRAERDGTLVTGDPLACAAGWLRSGDIVAVKGLGGFHLACDATNVDAIRRLRDRKRRPSKPLALMAALDVIRRYAEVPVPAAIRLSDPAAPIVLLPRNGQRLPDELAPGIGSLGWMLPYTPLHHLLLDIVGRPLVMTSGNLSGEPQVIDDDEARQKLSAFADGFLFHDRRIARRLDDGIETLGPAGPVILRRARGRVPGTLPIPDTLPGRQVVAFGGQLKSAICLAKNGQAMLSHHLGDLDEPLTVEEFLKADADMADLFDHAPEVVAVDLHPDFRATSHGRTRAETLGVPVIEVQHHHAHMAAALGEAGWTGVRAVGIILDGLGLGPDGTVWGGEVLVGDYARFERAAYLKPAPLVGGDRAQAEPWRNAVARLDAADLGQLASRMFPGQPVDMLRQAGRGGLNAPPSSSMGRLFDAVAACLGLASERQTYEGEAAMRLEAIATASSVRDAYPFNFDGTVIDPSPMLRELAADLEADVEPHRISARFHGFVAKSFAEAAKSAARESSTRTIALSGGCFQNMTLLRLVMEELSDFHVCGPGEVPANDGGLAYGQVLVALARLESV